MICLCFICCMETKTLLRIGELVYCSSPEGFYELPKGLPDNALAEVVAAYVDNTYVRYSGVTFALPNDCVHRALPDFERNAASRSFVPHG